MEINEQYAAIIIKRGLESKNEAEKVNLVSGIDGKKIPIHRFILSAASKYFADLLQANENDMGSRFVLADSDSETIKTVVDYCYSGNIVLTEQNAAKCLQVAVNEDFDLLLEKCHEYFSSKLSVENVVHVSMIADKHNIDDLRQRALELISSEIEKVSVTKIVQLKHSMMQRLLENGAANELLVQRLIDWFRHDEDARGEHMPEMLRLIRLDQLKVQFLSETIEPVFMQFKCGDLLMKEYKRRAINSVCTSCSESRPPSQGGALSKTLQSDRMENVDLESIYIVCVTGRQGTKIVVDRYDKSSNRFTRHFTSPDMDSFCYGTVLYKNKLFVMGGRQNGIRNSLDSVITYDLTTGEKETLASMNEPRWKFTSIVMGKWIYVFGGMNENDLNISSCERYDTETNKWETIKSMNDDTTTLSAAILNGVIYVIYVTDECYGYTELDSYDPKTNEWTTRKSLDVRGWAAQLGVLNGILYCFVGLEFRRYDPELDEWSTMDEYSLFRSPLLLESAIRETIAVNDSLFALDDDDRTLKQMKIDENKKEIVIGTMKNVTNLPGIVSLSIHRMG